MTLTEVACYINRRPIATILELTTSTLARLMGFKGADFFMEIVPKEDVQGQPFFWHERGQTEKYRSHEFQLGRLHLIAEREC